MRRLLQPLVILIAGFLSASALGAQVIPKKIVFVSSVGSAPPPVTSSTIFKVPAGVAIGASVVPGSITGTIYVADPDNNQVVAFLPDGSTTLFTTLTCPSGVRGCFGGGPWTLSSPTFVATTSSGNIWISDTGNDVVVEIDPTGKVLAFAGVGPSGVVNGCTFGIGCPSNPNAGQANGQFFGPGPLAVDGLDNLYVADAAGDLALNITGPAAANIRIEKFASDGTFTTTWGSFCVLNADGTQFSGSCNTSSPGAVAFGDGQLSKVNGIAVDGNSAVYVSEEGNNRVQKFNANGTFLLKWGGLPQASGDGQFKSPGGVAVDLDQTIYVTDIANNRIQEFDSSGAFIAKGGSMGSAEAQFTKPFGIASVPPGIAFACLFGTNASDCIHGIVVSEIGGAGGNKRVQFLAGRADSDNDGITDEIDLQPTVASTSFSDASLGFTTTGGIINPGDQTFYIYNTLTPAAIDEVRVRTETFGGALPLMVSLCGAVPLSFSPGSGGNIHCSTPTVVAEFGPVGFQFTGTDGTVDTGTLKTGDSLSFSPQTSTIQDNAGNVAVTAGGKTIVLSPGQPAFADSTPPTSVATLSVNPNAHNWNNTTVAVNVSATDNLGGSGVSAITYDLTGAQTGGASVPGSTASVPISAQGVTTVSFFSTDNAGNQETEKSVTVRIDKTPPQLVCSASPSVLKPTGHLVPVNLSVSVNDGLSGPDGFGLSSVTSNERQPDKDIAHDIQGFSVGTPSTSGFLRAEGGGRERQYTFIYTGSDLAGNHGSCTVTVKVRHRDRDEDE